MKPFALLIVLAAVAPQVDAESHTITVYSRSAPGAIDPRVFESQISNPDHRREIPGYAIVRTQRDMQLEKGTGWARFSDVAAGIDPSTVSFESLTDADGTHVLEQNYRYDLVSTERILDRYLGETLTVDQVQGDEVVTFTGRLMAARHGDLILQTEDDALVSLGGGQRNIRFSALPEGLITRPTLEWLVQADRGGKHTVRVAYETLGMTWWADYNAIYSDQQGCRLDFSAWVSLVNQSGGSFEDAKLKLIAGDVHRAPRGGVPEPMAREMRMAVAEAQADGGFEEKAFFEYHLYTLGRQVDLPDRSLKQIELFDPVQDIPCRKRLQFAAGLTPRYGGRQPYTSPQFPARPDADVEVFLSFKNDREHGLGVPLPRGRIRVNQEDADDGSLEFIGEDTIDHTPRNEEIELKIGDVFDVVGERSQADFRWSKEQQWMDETIEVTLRNQKDEAVVVDVRESLFRWTNWEITKTSHEFEKIDASTISFEVEIPPESEKTVRYVAHYTW